MPKRTILLIPLFMLAGVSDLHADAFKCRTVDGKVLISSNPCEDGAKTITVHSAAPVDPEQRILAEKEVERQRKVLAEQEAERNSEERQERQIRQRLAEEESSRRTLCLQDARQEKDPALRADLIAACNGAAPQRPVVVQQPVLVPAGPTRRNHRPGWACVGGDCKTFEPPARPATGQGITGCRLVGSLMRCD